jgi:hypothetical protein
VIILRDWHPCPGGEIGKHTGFKIRRSKELEGSIPSPGTYNPSISFADYITKLRTWENLTD